MILTDESCSVLMFRHVVPASCCLQLVPASSPSMGCCHTSLPANKRGPKIWLASGHFSHVHQQVRRPLSRLSRRPVQLRAAIKYIEILLLKNMLPFYLKKGQKSALNVFYSHTVGPPPTIGGLMLNRAVINPNYEGVAVFTPVINGKWKKIT